MSTEIETTATEQRDEMISAELMAGRSVRSIQKQFGINTAELDRILEKRWPIDLAARRRMVMTDLGKLDQLAQVFFEKGMAGDVPSGTLAVKIWERKHELVGLNAATRIEVVQAPADQPDDFQRIYDAISRCAAEQKAKRGNGTLALKASDPDPDSDPDPGPLDSTSSKRGTLGDLPQCAVGGLSGGGPLDLSY